MSKTNLLSIEKIEKAIYFIRGEKVMLDRDLASLYDVSTGALNQAVRRNRDRFPADFMFQLTSAEVAEMNLSQIVIGSEKHRDPRLRPYAFTEQGVAMLSSATQQACDHGQHRHYARVRETPTDLRVQRRTCSPAG